MNSVVEYGEGEIDEPLPQTNSPTSSSSSSSSSFSGGEREKEYHKQIIYEAMNPVGGFSEGEINGKPFHIFNFLSQTDTSSSSSGEAAIVSCGDDIPPPRQPLFICQTFHWSAQWIYRRDKDPNGGDFLPVDVSPYPQFLNKRSGDQQFRFLIGSKIYHQKCKLPLVPLFWCNNEETDYEETQCGVCKASMLAIGYYLCVRCDEKFHKECIECPLEIKHPSYPFSSLKLYYPPHKDSNILICISCQEPISEMLYYCPTYKLMLHPVCAMKPIPIFIDHPKRHPHPLTFFPKQNSLPCDVCGLIREFIPTYVCARCVFVVHQDCVYSPNVIKISRHLHRISFTYSFPSEKLSCGVCRRKVDNNYGAYSCNKCDDYFVHTKCALREDLWDGEELEGIPEEPEIVVEPFETIADGIILHFSHDHHLKLKMSKVYDEDKFCQACSLPIYEDSYYSCMEECDFILHEACANAPRRKHHPLHAHPLTLTIDADFFCEACGYECCGFVYESSKKLCLFRLDLRCASVSEPFKYEGHKHPLFLALSPEEEESALCQICQEEGDENNEHKKLNCIECSFVICFRCATLPYKARYKHDKHFLTFREKEEASDHQGWCDACEGKIEYSRKGGFYSCDDYCSTTLHVDCLLGEDPYMTPGHTKTIAWTSAKIDILRNNTMSRPLCCLCKQRCTQKVVFKIENQACCSFDCAENCGYGDSYSSSS